MTRVPDEIIAGRAALLAIRCDNGPELTSRHFLAWGDRAAHRVATQPAGRAEWPAGRRRHRTIARRVFADELVSEPVRRTAQDRGGTQRV
jgi:hypothetical protein